MRGLAAAARLLDRYVGQAACGLLYPFQRGSSATLPPAPRRILVMKFWEGGLIVMGAPWYRALRRRYPSAVIDFLTLDVNAQLCGMLGAADRVIPLRVSAGAWTFFKDLLSALPVLRAASYDLALDLEFLSRFSALLAWAVAPACSVGFRAAGVFRGRPHGITVPFDPKNHMTVNYSAFFSAAGVEAGAEDSRPLESSPAALAAAGPGPFIVLNFDRKDIMPERAWPRENYAAVLGAILKAGRYAAVVIGQRRVELPAAAGLVNLSGRLDYPALAGLFSRASLFITHDSGPLHIAAAMGCPTVSIFGPETPAGYAPLGARHKALYLGLPCSPCVDATAGKTIDCVRRGNECVTGVTPEMVLRAAEELLK